MCCLMSERYMPRSSWISYCYILFENYKWAKTSTNHKFSPIYLQMLFSEPLVTKKFSRVRIRVSEIFRTFVELWRIL